MPCKEAVHAQAFLDGETTGRPARDIEAHIASCADCTALKNEVELASRLLRSGAANYRAPPDLRERVAFSLSDAAAGAPKWQWLASLFERIGAFWAGIIGGAMAAACAAAVAFFLFYPATTNPLIQDLLSAHLRSLMPDHLIDVASSDHHTVKPWFAGRTDVSPPVADFPGKGFSLIGGRIDYIDGHRAAVVVYRHGAHVVNLFAWHDASVRLPDALTRNGYHFMFWRDGDIDYCAVSDTAAEELRSLVALLRPMTAADGRE